MIEKGHERKDVIIMTKWMDSENTELLEEELLDKLNANYSLFYGGYIVEIKKEDLEDCISDVVSSNFFAINRELFNALPNKMVFPMEQEESSCNAKFMYLDVVKNYIEYVASLAWGVVL